MSYRRLLEDAERQNRPPPGAIELMGAQSELSAFRRSLEQSDSTIDRLSQLVPIRVIACVEGCLKAGTAALINFGDPYLENGRKLFKEVKLDFDVLRALLEDRLSLGEIVAESVGWHDLDAINSRMSTLLGCPFFETLACVEDRWDVEVNRSPRKPIVESMPAVLASLNQAIALRHTLCHEVAQFQRIPVTLAVTLLTAGEQFTGAVAWLVSETLHPEAPLTQADMNINAGQLLMAAKDEMERQLEALAAKLDSEDGALLTESQSAWSTYCRAFSELEGNAVKGGTLRPTVVAGAREEMCRNRAAELRECLRSTGIDSPPRRQRRSYRS